MSTYYTAGGMPLAFTQEDFLVCIYLHKKGFNTVTFESTIHSQYLAESGSLVNLETPDLTHYSNSFP